MRIRLLSDLHTEFGVSPAAETYSEYRGEDVVVLAGDIAVGAVGVAKVLEHFAKIFPQVVYVPGNHEYYGSQVEEFDNEISDWCLGQANIHLLDRNSVVVGEVEFVGATLWTNFGENIWAKMAAKKMINDFRSIKHFSPDAAEARYNRDVEYIQQALQNRQARHTCVVTHFLPAQACIAPQYRNPHDLTNLYFANGLDNYIGYLPETTWMFGHTHTPMDFCLGNTRLVCNPCGYPGERNRQQFNPFKEIVL